MSKLDRYSAEGGTKDNEGRGREERGGGRMGLSLERGCWFSLSRECSAIGTEQLHERGTNDNNTGRVVL